jgi:transcriptional regulator with XRE-family HTH domain
LPILLADGRIGGVASGAPVDPSVDERGTQESISSLVRLLLEFRGPKKQELADELGMSPASLSQRLGNSERQRPWRVHEVRALAVYYKISTDALLGDSAAREEVLEDLKDIAAKTIEDRA